MHRLHPECLCPVPVFTESVGFDWPARIKRPFEGEDEKKPKICTCSSKAEDNSDSSESIRYDAITCRDISSWTDIRPAEMPKVRSDL